MDGTTSRWTDQQKIGQTDRHIDMNKSLSKRRFNRNMTMGGRTSLIYHDASIIKRRNIAQSIHKSNRIGQNREYQINVRGSKPQHTLVVYIGKSITLTDRAHTEQAPATSLSLSLSSFLSDCDRVTRHGHIPDPRLVIVKKKTMMG